MTLRSGQARSEHTALSELWLSARLGRWRSVSQAQGGEETWRAAYRGCLSDAHEIEPARADSAGR